MRRTRVKDGSVWRLMGKWLHAGVMEEGVLTHPETGVAQGGVISPLLANIFLHHVLDEWFERAVRPRMKGRCFLMRFADDFVIGCELETDARRIMAVLPKRFARFGLRIQPTKTALIAFRKPDARQETEDGNGTFDLLGLPHYWTQSRRGCWVIKRKTASKRIHRTKKSLWRWCHTNRHAPLQDQYQMLCLKLRGHFQSDGMRGNFRMVEGIAHVLDRVAGGADLIVEFHQEVAEIPRERVPRPTSRPDIEEPALALFQVSVDHVIDPGRHSLGEDLRSIAL
jgi:hypothetical protein